MHGSANIKSTSATKLLICCIHTTNFYFSFMKAELYKAVLEKVWVSRLAFEWHAVQLGSFGFQPKSQLLFVKTQNLQKRTVHGCFIT